MDNVKNKTTSFINSKLKQKNMSFQKKFLQPTKFGFAILTISTSFFLASFYSSPSVSANYGGYVINPSTNNPTTNNTTNTSVPSNTTNNQTNKDVGAKNLTIYVDDPYTCGGNLFGNATGGNGQLKLGVGFYRLSDNVLAYAFEPTIKNGKWELAIDYSKVVSDKYRVVTTVRDEQNYTATAVLNIDLKPTSSCTPINNLTTVLIRTGGFVQENSLMTASSLGIFTLACSLLLRLSYQPQTPQR